MDAVERARAARRAAADAATEAQNRGDEYAAAVYDLVLDAGTQEKAAAILGISQSRVAALVKRARALAGQL